MGMSMSAAVNIASVQTKTSKHALHGIIQDYGAHLNLKTPKNHRRTKNYFEKLRPSQRHLIRVIIHDQIQKCNQKKKDPDSNEGTMFPTVKLLFKVIQDHYSEEFPGMTEWRLWMCMRRLGFRYKKHPDTKNVLLIGMYSIKNLLNNDHAPL